MCISHNFYWIKSCVSRSWKFVTVRMKLQCLNWNYRLIFWISARSQWRRFRFSQFPSQMPLLIFVIPPLECHMLKGGEVNDARIMHHCSSPTVCKRPSIHAPVSLRLSISSSMSLVCINWHRLLSKEFAKAERMLFVAKRQKTNRKWWKPPPSGSLCDELFNPRQKVLV